MDDELGGAKPKIRNSNRKPSAAKTKERKKSTDETHNDKHIRHNLNVDDTGNGSVVRKSRKKNLDNKNGIASDLYKDLVTSNEQEYMSAKERWKKSGQALRRYIADKLGLKNGKQGNRNMTLDTPPRHANRAQGRLKVKSLSSDSAPQSKGIGRSRSFLEKMGIKKGSRHSEEQPDIITLRVSKSFDSSNPHESSSSITDNPHSSDSSLNIHMSNVLHNGQCSSHQTTHSPITHTKKKNRAFPPCTKKEKSQKKEKLKKVKHKEKGSSCNPIGHRTQPESSDEEYELVFGRLFLHYNIFLLINQ